MNYRQVTVGVLAALSISILSGEWAIFSVRDKPVKASLGSARTSKTEVKLHAHPVSRANSDGAPNGVNKSWPDATSAVLQMTPDLPPATFATALLNAFQCTFSSPCTTVYLALCVIGMWLLYRTWVGDH